MDELMVAIRYLLIGGGMFLAGRSGGRIDPAGIVPMADTIIGAIGGVVAAVNVGWGMYVRWRTKAVPIATAARADVPVVSPVTGEIVRETPK